MELAPGAVELKSIVDRIRCPIRIDRVLHRKPDVILSIRNPSDLRDCPLGNDLGDKDDTSSALVALLAANVESEVHFIKVSMKRDRKKAKELGVTKPEAHQADIGSPFERIEYGSRRDIAAQECAVHFVVQHHEVPPFS